MYKVRGTGIPVSRDVDSIGRYGCYVGRRLRGTDPVRTCLDSETGGRSHSVREATKPKEVDVRVTLS